MPSLELLSKENESGDYTCSKVASGDGLALTVSL
mgnify:CR=1 FL=1